MAAGGHRVLILGGMGFIGRNLFQYLAEQPSVLFVRIADKVLPSTAFLSAAHKATLELPKVEFKQSNLTNEASIKRAFTDAAAAGKVGFADGDKFNFVINLAAETKFGQTAEVYAEKILDLATKVGNAAKAHNVDKFVEVSSAQVYESGSKASNEGAKLKPWTVQAQYKLKAEEALSAIAGLPLVIARPAIVYGPGDVAGLAPRIITGAVYTHLKEKMKFLWTKDLKLGTVHVHDVCVALWKMCLHAAPGSLYNLADPSGTDQGAINTILEEIYASHGLKTGFLGGAKSKLAAAVSMRSVCEAVNEKHLKPWSDLCKAAGIQNSPLTPYLDVELLMENSLSVDGSKVCSLDGFSYSHPKPTAALLRESIEYFRSQGLFPVPV